MNVVSQENANCFVEMKAPSNAPIPPTTIRIIGTFRHLERSSGSTCSDVLCEAILLNGGGPSSTSYSREVLLCSMRSELQGAKISDNRPSVFDFDL